MKNSINNFWWIDVGAKLGDVVEFEDDRTFWWKFIEVK